MSKRPQYLVIVPPGLQRSPALFRAMALAKQSEAEITLALFEFDAGLAKISAKGFDLAAYLEGRRRELEQFAKHLREEGFSVRSDVHWGSPITAQILAQIDRLQPELGRYWAPRSATGCCAVPWWKWRTFFSLSRSWRPRRVSAVAPGCRILSW
jgi:hypothetical protein